MWKTLSPGNGDGAIFTVNGHESIAERRHYPRSGVVSRLEDITYSVLREYEIPGEAASELDMMRRARLFTT